MPGFLAGGLLTLGGVGGEAASLPAGFRETTVFAGLVAPTAVKFAPDGRVFVAEKSGIIKAYASVLDPTPAILADLRPQVLDYWDRGLLGMTLDPAFPARPYVYVLYALDKNPADPTSTVPTWNDACPSPPGPNASGCPVLGRLSRLDASAPWPVQATEQVLLESFPQQFPSHSVGGLAFGADGALYVSVGEGASFVAVDYGQFGGQSGAGPGQQVPRNPLGDPPGGIGATLTAPTAQGGALRSQSLRRGPGRPVALSGVLLRVDPDTGAALPDNPLFAEADPNARRIVAYGLRNPLRFALRPGTEDLFVADVGWNQTEEINRFDLGAGGSANFGWPCYEGAGPQAGYEAAGLALCQALYAEGSARPPFFAYDHSAKVVAGESCPTGTSSISGLAFYGSGSYPAAFQGALFFSDWARKCLWAMLPDASGAPDPSRVVTVVSGMSGGAVALEAGPGGDVFYVDYDGGRVVRLGYESGNRSPVARATANPISGEAPLEVQFDGSLSSDPDGDSLIYAWDFDGDGNVDSTAVSPGHTFTGTGPRSVRLTVEDPLGARASALVTVYVDNQAPQAVIGAPTSGLTWRVGDPIAFSGGATDPDEGALPASALRWTLLMHHCPSDCHVHTIQGWNGVASGSFVAPDHEYPSWLELRLVATDAGGLEATASVALQPQTASVTLESDPPGLILSLGSEANPAPFVTTVIVGSSQSVAAPSPQWAGGVPHGFRSWSDGGAASHTIVAPPGASTLRATFRPFADLSVTATSGPVVQGGRLTLSATVANAGPATATGVRLAAPLPPGAALVSSVPGGACAVIGTQLECALADLAPAAETALAVVVRPSLPGAQDFAFEVSSAEAEATPQDNQATAPVEVRAAGDFDGNVGPDLLWQNATTGVVGAWNLSGQTVTASGPLVPDRGPDARWTLGGLGDFDADGRFDLVFRNPATGVNEVWIMEGLVRRSVLALPPVADPAWGIVGVGDFDGDGWPDLVWRHGGTGQNYLTRMVGGTPSGGVPLPTVAPSWEVVGVADVSGDGKLDLLWRRSSDGLNAALLMNGTSPSTTVALPSPADAGWRVAALFDHNGDGASDLVFRHATTGAVAVVYLAGTQAAGSAALPAATAAWRLVGPR